MAVPALSGPHGIAVRRGLLVVAIAAELGFCVVTRLWLAEQHVNPLLPCLALVALLSAMLLGTYLSELVRSHARELASVTIYAVSAHSLYLAWVNHLDPHYVMGLCMLVAGVVATSIYTFRHRRDLQRYLAFFVVGSLAVWAGVEAPLTEPAFFGLIVATLVALTYVAVSVLLGAVARERESRRQHELIVHASPDTLVRVRDGVIADAPALRGEVGRRVREVIGAPVGRLLDGQEASVEGTLASVLRHGVPQRIEGPLRVPGDGDEERPAMVAELRFVRVGPNEALVHVRDRTEERRLEEHLVQSDRMAAVGTLAFGIAHEINNPLSFVQNNTEWVIEALRDRSDEAGRPTRKQLLEALQDVHDGGRRIHQIVEDLLLSAHGGTGQGRADVQSAVGSAVKLAGGQLRHRTRLEVDLPELPPLALPESRLVQVVLNLLVNAAQALPGRAIDQNRVAVRAVQRGSDRVAIEVQDNGKGIDQAELGRVLEPFFTTKPAGMGTGLGLYVTHQIVTAAGGRVDIDSTVGEGTTVTLLLPVAEPSEEAEPTSGTTVLPARRSDGTRKRILVVDDEPAVARGLARALREHDVHVVEDGAAALAQLSAESFDVILCDLMMPGLSGMQLYEQIDQETRARVAFVTGGAFDPDARAFVSEVPAPVLAKPLDLDEVRATIVALSSWTAPSSVAS